ncbi:Gfo/Idh/MocA family protein [Epibacterium ulvae]|uniref:Gfo/Idh/MocA family protein n=1 Tax=Epibacterium ulvae TaxID=1156985 RepID=UPI002492C5C4|nr:Gfo/Idh/MocA family oxidoreductase [Epibacterium ulvae]
MADRSSLRVACLGAGYFSQFHIGSWQRQQNVELVAICDRDISRAKAFNVPAFDNLEQMLHEVQPDLLDIILPPEGHAAAVRTALATGLRRIVCQKPFCTSYTEAAQITAEAEAHGATIIIHENFRFQPWYRCIKDAMDAGRIGTPVQATFRLRPGDGQGPRAYLDRQPYFQTMQRFLVHETAVHWVDTFRFLFGEPVALYADLRRVNPVIAGEDAAHVLFEHQSGLRALFDGNRTLDHAADNLRRTMGEALIEGTQGSLTVAGNGAVHLRPFGSMDTIKLLGANTAPTFGGDCAHHLQSHVVSGFLKGTPLENRAADYLNVIRIKDKIYQSAQEGRKIQLENL